MKSSIELILNFLVRNALSIGCGLLIFFLCVTVVPSCYHEYQAFEAKQEELVWVKILEDTKWNRVLVDVEVKETKLRTRLITNSRAFKKDEEVRELQK